MSVIMTTYLALTVCDHDLQLSQRRCKITPWQICVDKFVIISVLVLSNSLAYTLGLSQHNSTIQISMRIRFIVQVLYLMLELTIDDKPLTIR